MNLSIFFPAFNEEANLEKTIGRALEVVRGLVEIKKFEIIIVNDGSTDRTGEIADRLVSEISEVRAVHHSPNHGYGGALKTGFKEAKYPWVCFTDSDGQFDFAEITKFLEKVNEADLILGYRIGRADSFLRRLYTWGWALLPRIFFGLKVRDYSCGFKLIKKEVFEAVQPLVGEEKVTQIEMLVKAGRKGFKFAEVGVHHYPRTAGTQTGANLKVVLKSLKDLLTLRRHLG